MAAFTGSRNAAIAAEASGLLKTEVPATITFAPEGLGGGVGWWREERQGEQTGCQRDIICEGFTCTGCTLDSRGSKPTVNLNGQVRKPSSKCSYFVHSLGHECLPTETGLHSHD
jgi:hypothetical protein